MITIDTISFTLNDLPEHRPNKRWVSKENLNSGKALKHTWLSEDKVCKIIKNYDHQNTTVTLSSATRYMHGHALMRGIESMNVLTDKLQCQLDDVLRGADIMNATVRRFDNSTIYEVDAPVKEYLNALVQALPQSKGHYNKEVHENTLKLHTKSTFLSFYDKRQRHLQEAKDLGIQGNLLRYEVGMSLDAIKSHLGTSSLRHLCEHEDKLIKDLQKYREHQYDRLIKRHTSSERHLSTLNASNKEELYLNYLFDLGASPEVLEHRYDQMQQVKDRTKRRYKQAMREAYARHQSTPQIMLFNDLEKHIRSTTNEHYLSQQIRATA